MSDQLKRQIASAKETLIKMKTIHPYLFVEYAKYEAAKSNLEKAKQEYDAAKKAWEKIGND